jgi:hypothetical protein
MSQSVTLTLLALASFILLWMTGGYAVKKLVVAIEGSTEFGQGTTSRLRRLKGYGLFSTWLLLATLPASYFADVGVHGDADAATRRLVDRLEVVVHLLSAMGDDD